ncbi:MAG: hypothetical protein ACX933_07735 [Marinobacter adhaerens]
MGILNGLRNTVEKSKAAVVVQNILGEHPAEMRMMGGIKNHKTLATNLVENVWDQQPDVFSGKFGQRPHKITVAATAFGHELDRIVNYQPSYHKGYFLVLNMSLGMILEELEKNGRLYPLNSLDKEILGVTINLYEEVTKDLTDDPMSE